MHMAPDSLPIAALFPVRRSNEILAVPLEESYELKAHAEDDAEAKVIAAAAVLLGHRLQWSCTPAHRLRCACFGRNLRSQQSENGLENARNIVLEEVKLAMEEREMRDAAEAERHSHLPASRSRKETETASDEGGGGAEWQELDNGVQFATHHLTAPEETSFLFNEVFLERAYLQHGIRLAENDLVIDVGAFINLVLDLMSLFSSSALILLNMTSHLIKMIKLHFAGANIGFFAVFAELEFEIPDALRLIVIEPCLKNFQLLQENMELYAPTAHLVQAAISSVPRNKKRSFNASDCNVGKRRDRASINEIASSQYEVKGCLRRGKTDVEDEVKGPVEEEEEMMKEYEQGLIVEGRENEGELEDDDVAKKEEEEEEEAVGAEHAFMTYYPRMPGNSRMTHLVGDGPLNSNSSFLTGSCQERVAVKTLSDVIDDYESKNEDSRCDEDGEGSCGYRDDARESSRDVGGHSSGTRGRKSEGNIALLKIDVEGSELCVLQSIEHRHWIRIDQIVIEIERPREGAEGPASVSAAADIIHCNTHRVGEDKQSNYHRVCNLLKLHGFRLLEEWGAPGGYDTGCLLLFGIKEKS